MRPASIDDVDEDALVLPGSGRLDDGPEGGGGPAAASDDLSVVILVHRELEHERAVVLLELLDLDLLGPVDDRLRQVLEEVAWQSGRSALGDALRAQELLHGVR